jgi:hypothetical protein
VGLGPLGGTVNAGRALVGMTLIGIGTVFFLDANGTLDAGETLGRWWPVAVVLLGALQVASERRLTLVTAALIGVGLLLLAGTTGVLGSADWGLVWPLALIVAGLGVLWSRRRPVYGADDELTGLAVFSGTRVGTRSTSFRRASVTAVFGGLTLDLSEAGLAEGARVSATVAFGGIDVIVPPGWRVVVKGIPLFGGWDDTTARSPVGADVPRLEIQALVLFGGLEVRHPRRWG